MGSFVVANPRRLGIAATQDDKTVRVAWGKEAARFAVYILPEDLFSAKRAASFPLSLPLNPVILNEMVLSLRSTSEMKDLILYSGI